MDNLPAFDDYNITRELTIKKIAGTNEVNADTIYCNYRRVCFYMISSLIISFLLYVIFVLQSVNVENECVWAGRCSVYHVSDGPTYKVFYENEKGQRKILSNPESSFAFGDDVVVPGQIFRFRPYLLIFKSVVR